MKKLTIFLCFLAFCVPVWSVPAASAPQKAVPAKVLEFKRGDFLSYEEIFGNVFKGASKIELYDRYLISQRGSLSYKKRTGTLEHLLRALKKSAGASLKTVVLHFEAGTIGGNAKNFWKSDLDELALRLSRDEKISLVIGPGIDHLCHSRRIEADNGVRLFVDPGLTSLHDADKVDYRDPDNLLKRPLFRDGFIVYIVPAKK
ncbi:MAG: hypothetical protein K6B46_04265 [Opitutales bacterium]|nr:hypothetical protein [Opitutales bacterium]